MKKKDNNILLEGMWLMLYVPIKCKQISTEQLNTYPGLNLLI